MKDVIAGVMIFLRGAEAAGWRPVFLGPAVSVEHLTAGPRIQARRKELVTEAKVTLKAICPLDSLKESNPLTDPTVMARAVTRGILYAPQLRNNPFGCGQAISRVVNGAFVAIDSPGHPLLEAKRLALLIDMT